MKALSFVHYSQINIYSLNKVHYQPSSYLDKDWFEDIRKEIKSDKNKAKWNIGSLNHKL